MIKNDIQDLLIEFYTLIIIQKFAFNFFGQLKL